MRVPITNPGILLLAFLFVAGGDGVAAQTSHPGGAMLTPSDREAIEGLAAGYAERALAVLPVHRDPRRGFGSLSGVVEGGS